MRSGAFKCLLSVAVIAFLPASAAAQEVEVLGTFGDWEAAAYTVSGVKTCYLTSVPKKAEGKYKKRGDVFAFVTDIVRKNVLDVPKHGTIQYHPSLLPKNRGISSMAWPVINGETKTGVSIFWVDEGIDTGPILIQREVDILPEDTVGSMYFDRLYPMGIEMLTEAVKLVREGNAPRIDQDHSQASYEPPIRAEHGIVDFTRPGPIVYNHVRGCDPQPGASVSLNGETRRLFNPSYATGHPQEAPGTVTGSTDGAIAIAVIGGTLTIARVQAKDARKVAAAELVNVGDVLERDS